jgi:DHA1 family inner membrane transport protein
MRAMPRLLWLFAFVNLVIGTSAFVIGGILEPISTGLGVSIPTAGQAMTAYALATAVLAPLAMLATGHWPRRAALIGALVLATAGNALSAAGTSFTMLLAGRALMGAGAVFMPIAAGIALALVEPARSGQALARVFLGVSIAYVVGMPIGAWLGLRLGWQAPLWLTTALLLAALALVAALVPRDIRAPGASFAGLGALLRRADVIAVLAVTLLYFCAIFSAFSYVGPLLQSLVAMSAEALAATLSLFGLAGVAGTLLGGIANDRFGPRRTLSVQLGVLGAMMALLPLTRGAYPAMVAVLVAWAMAGFGMMAPQQSRLAALAPAHAPLLLSLNSSMLYVGTALGAAVGGVTAAHLGLAHLSWASVPFVAAALAILRFGPHRRVPGAPSPRQEIAT